MAKQKENLYLKPPTCDDRLLWDTWMSTYNLPTLIIADEIDLFLLLERAPATAKEVATKLSLDERALEGLLGVMASLGFLVQHQGKFYITEVSRNFLLPDSPYYWGGILHHMQTRPITPSLLREALQREKSISYEDAWKNHEQALEKASLFTQAMHSHSFPTAMSVARRGDFTGVKRLLDVGGGSGCFCISLASRYPEMHLTVMDLPIVCKLTEQYIADFGLQDQINTLAIDMFKDPWPFGYDAVFFSNIFRDWDREKCLYLSRRSFEVLPPRGRIYLNEMLLGDTRDGPLTTISFSMQRSFTSEGKQFTASELDELLRECGFEDVILTSTYGYYSLISGRKP